MENVATETEQTTTETPALTAESIAAIVNTQINNFVKSSKTDIAKLRDTVTSFSTQLEAFKPKEAAATTESADTKYSVLERQLKDLQTSNEQALAKAALADRNSALNTVLSGFNFANETARNTAFKVFSSEMETIGEGAYAIGDQPLKEAVSTRMADLTGLLAPKAQGGSGATPGRGTSSLSVNDIKPGMSMEELQQIANTIKF